MEQYLADESIVLMDILGVLQAAHDNQVIVRGDCAASNTAQSQSVRHNT